MLVSNKVEPFDLTQVVVLVGFWIVLQVLWNIKKDADRKIDKLTYIALQ
jgi:hypothetical protein